MFCCSLLQTPKRRDRAYDHSVHSTSDTPMVLVKSHGCTYRAQISDLSFKFSHRSEWLAQLKRNTQLWFLFSSSLCLLSDHESPVTGRVEPRQKWKQLPLIEPLPCTGLHLIFVTALEGRFYHDPLWWLKTLRLEKKVSNRQDATRVGLTPELAVSHDDVSRWGVQRRKLSQWACMCERRDRWPVDIKPKKKNHPIPNVLSWLKPGIL